MLGLMLLEFSISIKAFAVFPEVIVNCPGIGRPNALPCGGNGGKLRSGVLSTVLIWVVYLRMPHDQYRQQERQVWIAI